MPALNRNNNLYFFLSWILILIITIPVFYILFQIIEFLITNTKEAFNLLAEIRILNLLGRSILLSSIVSILTTIISLPLAYIFANYEFPLKKVLIIFILLPFFIPPYIYAISWINLIGVGGLIQTLNLNIYGFGGSVFVLTCWLFPLAFFFFMSSLRKNERLEEAAKLVKSKIRILVRITLPIILPGLLAGMIFSFILAITNFGVPGALRLNVFPSEIFIQFGAFFNHQQAIFLSFPLIILSGIFIFFFVNNYSGQLKKIEQKNEQSILKKLNSWRTFILYIFSGFLMVVVLVLPITSLLIGTVNLNNFLIAFSNTFQEIWHTIFYGAATVVILTIIGFYLALFRRNLTSHAFRAFLDIFILMQMTIPGTVYGIVLIKFVQISVLSSILSNPFAAVLLSDIRYLPVAYFICTAGLSRLPEKYLEAARLYPQGYWMTFRKIVMPLCKESLLGSLVIVFVLCFGELDCAIMVYPPGFETMPLRIYSLLHYGANEMVYALSLIQVLIILIIIVFGFRWFYKGISYYA